MSAACATAINRVHTCSMMPGQVICDSPSVFPPDWSTDWISLHSAREGENGILPAARHAGRSCNSEDCARCGFLPGIVQIYDPSVQSRLRSHACAAQLPLIQHASSYQPAAAKETEAAKERKRRNNNPGVRVQGGRIYCSETGTTCHQVAHSIPAKQCRLLK